MRFQDRVVIVTGASRGIGRETALAFAREGAKVACVATKVENAVETAKAANGIALGCDVSDTEQVEAMFKAVAEQLGEPDILVNNAGITRDTLLMRMKDDDWDRVINVNLKGAFLCCRAATRPMMKKRKGRMINVGSIVGLSGEAGQANYSAAKAGLVGLTKSIAKELGSRGVTCNSVAPGFIETDMTAVLGEDFRAKVIERAPAGRLGTPADIAAAILFLASDEAGYITGQTLVVDGGLTL
ncbi:3-oxoacyl-[acyl-carrier-protein] reductase [bacterium]|nr:MAG: 3-oxoacyl-[acyl-carrier-protein] reductase [bacterium]